MAKTLTQAEHDRISAAIRKAETNTAGEIYCVVARSSDSYFFSAALIVLAVILCLSLLIALALDFWWLEVRVPVFVGAQALASVMALCLIYWMPSLRLLLVPRRWQYMRANDNALRQFLSRNVHLTEQRTGVLIFVSMAERYAEILADAGINCKVSQDLWDRVVADLIEMARKDRLGDGFVSAIDSVAEVLTLHFPRRSGDVNELDDHLVEI